MLDDLPQSARIAGNDGGAGRHRLQGDDAKRLVEGREHRHVGDAKHLLERAAGHESGEQHLVLQAIPSDEPLELIALAPAHDEELRVRLFGEDGAGGVEQELDALFADEPAHVHHDLLVRKGELGPPIRPRLLRPLEREFCRVHAVEHDIDLVLGASEQARGLPSHELGTHDHAPCLVREPVLLLVDVALGVVVDAPVAALLGRVHRGNEGEVVLVLQLARAVQREPIVGVKQRGLASRAPVFEQGPHPALGRDVQQLDLVDEVRRFRVEVDPVYVHAACLDLLVWSERRVLGHHVDLDALGRELLRQVVHVRADSPDDPGRVLPREHDHPHTVAPNVGGRPMDWILERLRALPPEIHDFQASSPDAAT